MTIEDIVDIAYPQQPHCPTILILDTSGSMMVNDKIRRLNEGIRLFKDEIGKDELARKRLDLAVISFGQRVNVIRDFTSIDEFEPEELVADGLTPMGEAIKTAAKMLDRRKEEYKKEGIDYYRPWIFLITDGEPTDMNEGDELWNEVTSLVHDGEREGKFLFFAVGVENADLETLGKIAPPTRVPVKLKDNNFRDMFLWLSKSQSKVSASGIGDQIVLDDPFVFGWAEIPTI